MIILGSGTTRTVEGGGGGDPYWNNVVLLLSADSGFDDLSQSNHTIAAAFDSVTVSTEQTLFGTNTFKFPGSPQARIDVSDSAGFDFGTDDFTIEAFFYRSSGAAYACICNLGDYHTTGDGLALEVQSAAISYYRVNVSDYALVTVSNTEWHHIAISRTAGTRYLCFDGAILSSAASAHSFAPSNYHAFGEQKKDNADLFTGYMDQMRITKGVGRYTATYTVPTAPFPTA